MYRRNSVFFDDDLELLEDFIEKMLEPLFKYDEVIGICGTQITYLNRSKLYLYLSNFFKKGPYRAKYDKSKYYKEKHLVRMNKISGGITVYKKKIFNHLSFDENMVGYCLGEDADFSFNAQLYGIVLKCENAKAHHYHDVSGRINIKDDYDSRVCFYHYFYQKNLKTKRFFSREYLYYLLVLNGLFFDAVYKSISKKTFDPLLGVQNGLKKTKNNYKESKCLKIKMKDR